MQVKWKDMMARPGLNDCLPEIIDDFTHEAAKESTVRSTTLGVFKAYAFCFTWFCQEQKNKFLGTFIGYIYNGGHNGCQTLLHLNMSCDGVVAYEITHYDGTL